MKKVGQLRKDKLGFMKDHGEQPCLLEVEIMFKILLRKIKILEMEVKLF